MATSLTLDPDATALPDHLEQLPDEDLAAVFNATFGDQVALTVPGVFGRPGQDGVFPRVSLLLQLARFMVVAPRASREAIYRQAGLLSPASSPLSVTGAPETAPAPLTLTAADWRQLRASLCLVCIPEEVERMLGNAMVVKDETGVTVIYENGQSDRFAYRTVLMHESDPEY